MPWFVFRVEKNAANSIGGGGRVLFHRVGFTSRAEAEAHALDREIFANLDAGEIDESRPAMIVEANSVEDAVIRLFTKSPHKSL